MSLIQNAVGITDGVFVCCWCYYITMSYKLQVGTTKFFKKLKTICCTSHKMSKQGGEHPPYSCQISRMPRLNNTEGYLPHHNKKRSESVILAVPTMFYTSYINVCERVVYPYTSFVAKKGLGVVPDLPRRNILHPYVGGSAVEVL